MEFNKYQELALITAPEVTPDALRPMDPKDLGSWSEP